MTEDTEKVIGVNAGNVIDTTGRATQYVSNLILKPFRVRFKVVNHFQQDCTNGKEYGNEHGNDLRYPNQECRSLCQQWAESSVHWCTKHQCKLHTGKWGEDEWHSQVRDHQKATVWRVWLTSTFLKLHG